MEVFPHRQGAHDDIILDHNQNKQSDYDYIYTVWQHRNIGLVLTVAHDDILLNHNQNKQSHYYDYIYTVWQHRNISLVLVVAEFTKLYVNIFYVYYYYYYYSDE